MSLIEQIAEAISYYRRGKGWDELQTYVIAVNPRTLREISEKLRSCRRPTLSDRGEDVRNITVMGLHFFATHAIHPGGFVIVHPTIAEFLEGDFSDEDLEAAALHITKRIYDRINQPDWSAAL